MNNAELTIVSSLKHNNTQPIYIFNRKNPHNSEPQNGLRRGLDFIALVSPFIILKYIIFFQIPKLVSVTLLAMVMDFAIKITDSVIVIVTTVDMIAAVMTY